MRQIKFRAWNRIVERWQYFVLEDLQKEKNPIQWQNLEIMQFTGLFDKAGKEIYEGDVLLCEMAGVPFKSVVIYNEYAAAFQIQYEGALGGRPSDFLHRYAMANQNREIIGNIYDNPELLK